MNLLYAVCAVGLPVFLELGILRSYAVGSIGTAPTLSAGFAVAAFTIAAMMLRDTGFKPDAHH